MGHGRAGVQPPSLCRESLPLVRVLHWTGKELHAQGSSSHDISPCSLCDSLLPSSSLRSAAVAPGRARARISSTSWSPSSTPLRVSPIQRVMSTTTTSDALASCARCPMVVSEALQRMKSAYLEAPPVVICHANNPALHAHFSSTGDWRCKCMKYTLNLFGLTQSITQSRWNEKTHQA